SNYTACCPFHQEKSPSLYIYTDPGNQHYHCFGCGAHGGVIHFVQEFDSLSFPETIEQLARSIGLEVPRSTQEFKPDPNKPIIDALEWARELYCEQLRSHPQRQLALRSEERRVGKECRSRRCNSPQKSIHVWTMITAELINY